MVSAVYLQECSRNLLRGKISGKKFFLVLIILISAFSANFKGLKAPFQFDDEVDILERAAIMVGPINSAFSAPFRAVTYFTFGLDWKIGEGKPFQFHLTNMVFHLLGVFLFFIFVSKIEDPTTGAISALLLAVHPLMASCVTYISARAGLLSALFSLVVLILFFTRPTKYWLLPAWLFFLLALFSKEDAVSLPLLLFALGYLQNKSSLKSKKEILCVGAFFLIALIYGLVRISSHKVVLGEAGGLTFSQTLLLSPYVLLKALGMVLLPIGMTADHYVTPIRTFGDLRIWFPLSFWSITLACLLMKIKDSSLSSLPLIWFVLALLPSILTPLADPFAENRLYFATAGIGMGLGMLIMRVKCGIANSITKKIAFTLTLILMIGSLLLYNLHRQSVWCSKISLWGEAVRMAPGKKRPLNNLALAFFDMGDLKKAQFIIEKSIKVDPMDAVAWNTLGLVLKERKNYVEALIAYEKALSSAPYLPKIRTNLANVLTALGKYEEAIKAYKEALLIDSQDTDAHYGIAFVYFTLKQYELAESHLSQLLKLNPKDEEARLMLQEIENIGKK